MDRRSFLTQGALGAAAVAAAGRIGWTALAGDLAPAGATGAVGAAGSGTSTTTGLPGPWSIPDAAFVRALGVAPVGPCGPYADQQCAGGPGSDALRGLAIGNGLSVPGLGIPLGGVGAGSFMVNQFGTFGPWNFGGRQDPFWEQRILPQAAFHVREQVDGEAAVVRTLTVPQTNVAEQRRFGSVLPAWTQLEPGEGTYAALYPFAWMGVDAFASEVTMRMWSPIVAREEERTSMPVAFFEVGLANPSDDAVDLSVMLTFPNAAPHVGTATPSVRGGLSSRRRTDFRHGVVGVTMASSDPANTPDSADSEWTIAVRPGPGQHATHVDSWDADGDGGDVYAAFTPTGRLPDTALDSSASAAAIAVSVTLAPGESATVPFAIAWDFPQVEYGDDEVTSRWMRRYTGFLGGRQTATNDYLPGSYPGHQSFSIAARELARMEGSAAAVEAWWAPIAGAAELPAWLRKAALNELYQLAFSNSFWEAGLVSTTQVVAEGGPRLGSVLPGTHLFAVLGCGSGGDPTYAEVDVDSYSYLAFAKLFPALERGRLLAWLQQIAQNPVGRPMQNVVMGSGPYITARAATDPPSIGQPPTDPTGFGKGGDGYRDVPHKVIYRTFALYRETGDDSLIEYGFAPMLATLAFTQAFRPAGSHLPVDPSSQAAPNTYDQVVVDGHGIYNSQLYLLSLQILAALTPTARRLGVPEATPDLQVSLEQELAAAKAEFEAIFWNPDTGRYRFCDGLYGFSGRTAPFFTAFKIAPPPDCVLLDSFYAQGIAAQLGLPALVDQDRMRAHLRGTLGAFMAADSGGGAPTGPPIILKADLTPFRFEESFPLIEVPEVWIGTTYMAAAAAVQSAIPAEDDLVDDALRMAEVIAAQVFDERNGFAFDTPESWFLDDVTAYRYPAYARSLAVWQLVDALALQRGVAVLPYAVPSTLGWADPVDGDTPPSP